jgi:hypothetical protein
MDDYQMNDHQIFMMQLAAKGYTCSQIMIQLALKTLGVENPDLVRAMAGLAYGCGNGQAACGALTGGCCLIALYAAKGNDTETAAEHLPRMLNELVQWFETEVGGRYGGIICDVITGEGGPAAARERCFAITSDTFVKTMVILVAHGVDPYDSTNPMMYPECRP